MKDRSDDIAKTAALKSDLMTRAAYLQADISWRPPVKDLRRGYRLMLEQLMSPQNLSLTSFADFTNTSTAQVSSAVAEKRLLALSVGTRDPVIPGWQLDDVRLELTLGVLAAAAAIDEWTLFYTLSEPVESLDGKSPIDAVDGSNIDHVLAVVLTRLGIHK
jgi:hypothetical protein